MLNSNESEPGPYGFFNEIHSDGAQAKADRTRGPAATRDGPPTIAVIH